MIQISFIVAQMVLFHVNSQPIPCLPSLQLGHQYHTWAHAPHGRAKWTPSVPDQLCGHNIHTHLFTLKNSMCILLMKSQSQLTFDQFSHHAALNADWWIWQCCSLWDKLCNYIFLDIKELPFIQVHTGARLIEHPNVKYCYHTHLTVVVMMMMSIINK